MKTNRILLILLLICVFTENNAQNFDGIGGSIGFRISDFSVQEKEGITGANRGYSSLYIVGLNLKKQLPVNKLYLQAGINFSREQIGFHPLIKINDIPNLQTQFSDAFSVFEFRMWNYQLGLPIGLGMKLYNGWSEYFPFFWIPAINIHAGLMNNIVLNKTYNDVILLENYGRPNVVEYYDKTVNQQVSSYYLKTIGRYNLIEQLGLDFYAPFNSLDFGFSLLFNHYLTSPFSEMEIRNGFSMDIKMFFIYKIKLSRKSS